MQHHDTTSHAKGTRIKSSNYSQGKSTPFNLPNKILNHRLLAIIICTNFLAAFICLGIIHAKIQPGGRWQTAADDTTLLQLDLSELEIKIKATHHIDTLKVVNLNAAVPSLLVKELDFLPSYERAEFKWHLEEHNRHIVLTERQRSDFSIHWDGQRSHGNV
jgi:hypothetical protein